MNNLDFDRLDEQQIVALIPELLQLKGVVENNPWHLNDDVFVHSLTVADRLNQNLELDFVKDEALRRKMQADLDSMVGDITRREILQLSALLHDIAKPDTYIEENGATKCPGHEQAGAAKAVSIIGRILANHTDRDRAVTIIGKHDAPHQLMNKIRGSAENGVIEAFQAEYGDLALDLLLLGLSDTEGSQLSELNPDEFAIRINEYHRIFNRWGNFNY